MIGNYKIVALCMSRIQENFSHDFILTFRSVLKRAGYRLFVYNACSDLENDESKNSGQKYTFDLIDYSVIDALVVYEDRIRNRTVSDEIIAKGLQHGVPVVVLGDAHPGCVNIASNDPLGMEKMVRHLIRDHGVHNLHFIAGIRGEHYSDERIAAFKRVLAEFNIPYNDSMLSYGEYWAGPTEAAVERILAEDRLPEAFVCVNDHTALSVCAYLKNRGIRIPEEVKVTGYDGLFDTKMASPTVSTVNCSILEYSEQTLKAINSAFEGTWEEKTVLFEPELWKFESCGCAGQHTINAAEHIISLKDSVYRFHTDNQEMVEVMAKLQSCESPEQLAAELDHPRMQELCCVIEKRFLHEENALSDKPEDGSGQELVILYDGFAERTFVPYEDKGVKIIPGLQKFLEEDWVLAFSALSYLDIPMGYICFTFWEPTVAGLLLMPQVASFVGMGIGGYVSARHEHYLNRKIEEMYQADSLTGLYNRRAFSQEYQRLLTKIKEADKLTVILADVDDLKKINDQHGHAAGDIAICTVADALRYICPQDSLPVRFGGDEMLAVCRGEQDVAQIQERFYEYLDKMNSNSKRAFVINASIGIYVTSEGDKPEFEELVMQSDRLMYREKEKRKAERG